MKRLISEVESRNGTVLDELYEQCGYYMSSLKDDGLVKGSARVHKCISFLFPDGCEPPSCPKSSNLVVPLHCSLNMLEGDTGCSVWPSSLYLSEFVLSFPDIFSNKSCFEVGSGVGLVGICLSHVKASQVCCFYYLCCIEKITFSSYVSTSNVNLEEHAWKFIITYHFHK